MPSSRALTSKPRKSSSVPNCGRMSLCPPSAAPMAHGLPTSSGSAVNVLFVPLRLMRPIGWMGGKYSTSKPMLGQVGQPRLHVAKGAMMTRLGGRRTRKHLVPAAESRPLAVRHQFQCRRDRETAVRMARHDGGSGGIQGQRLLRARIGLGGGGRANCADHSARMAASLPAARAAASSMSAPPTCRAMRISAASSRLSSSCRQDSK